MKSDRRARAAKALVAAIFLVVATPTALAAYYGYQWWLAWQCDRDLVGRIAQYVGAHHPKSRPAERVNAATRIVDTRLTLPRGDHGSLLRDGPYRAWKTREGDCATAARIIILVLDELGIEAQRLIVKGHTAIAWRDGDVWRAGMGTRPPFAWFMVVMDGPPLEKLPFSYSFWNWTRFGIDHETTTPGPRWLVLLMESPSLIHVILSVVAVGISLSLFGVVWRLYHLLRRESKKAILASEAIAPVRGTTGQKIT